MRMSLLAALLLLFLLPAFATAQDGPDQSADTPADKAEDKPAVEKPPSTGELSAPERSGKRIRLADELEAQGDAAGALKILEELSAKDPENTDLLRRVGALRVQTGRLKEAIAPLKKLLELGDGAATDYGALGRLMVQAEEHEPALDLLEEAAGRFPEIVDFPFLKTFPLARLERWEEAVAQFRKTAELAEKTAPQVLDESFWYRYGAAHERIGNYDEAERFLRRTLALLMEEDATDEVADFFATVLNYLAYMWIERGVNLEEAGEMARDAAEISPVSGAIADTVGWYYFQTGNYPRALAELKRAERLLEEADPTIYDHLGQTLAKLNEKSFAADYFRKALELDPENAELKSRLAEVEE